MGFPSLNFYLKKMFVRELELIQSKPATIVSQVFTDGWDDKERERIVSYLNELNVTDDRTDVGKKYLYILPHYPLLDMAFPQIGISTGNEITAERGLGDETGEEVEIRDGSNNLIARDIERGYFCRGQYIITLLGNYEEIIWLATLCKYIVSLRQDELDGIGFKNVDISVADLKPNPELTPHVLFGREVTLSGLLVNTWYKRNSVSTTYGTGGNTEAP